MIFRIIVDLLLRLNPAYKWMPYKKYLKTFCWQNRRTIILWWKGGKCKQCGRTYGFHVHHKTYAHRGHERPWELEVLCWKCHGKKHGVVQ